VLRLTWERTMQTISATGSAHIVSIASCENKGVNIRLQIVQEDLNCRTKRLFHNK
jgi:hypothetical protein